MELASNGRATQSPGEAVVTRRCISFILRSTLGSLLGEKAQTNAAKQLCLAVTLQKRAVGERGGLSSIHMNTRHSSFRKHTCLINLKLKW